MRLFTTSGGKGERCLQAEREMWLFLKRGRHTQGCFGLIPPFSPLFFWVLFSLFDDTDLYSFLYETPF